MAARTFTIEEEIVRTQLDDLQSEFEAGARKLNTIADSAAEIRDGLLVRHLEQAHLAGALIRRIRDLQDSVRQQRRTLRELRHAIRDRRR
jgi:Mg2+ and Co2+ transporter CorA